MTDSDVAQTAELVDDLAVPPGTVLMREGRPGQDCFLVVAGNAEIEVDGRAVATIGPGDFIGDMALLDGKPRSVTVTATTEMQLFTIPALAFATLLGTSDVARALLQTMAHRMRGIRGDGRR